MATPVIAIGLDSTDTTLLENWLAQGHLKNLSQFRQQGAYGRIANTVEYCNKPTETSGTERLWVAFLTGCNPNKTGHWGSIKFHADNYKITHGDLEGSFESNDYPPFYAVGSQYRVAALDIPCTTLSNDVNGAQVLGWGGHFPHTLSHSEPADLLPSIIEKYGKNPVLHKDYGYWWDPTYFHRIQKDLKTSISSRTSICQDFLKQENWDLFLTVFGETHSASHDFWHLSQPDHPLYPHLNKGKGIDPMLDSFEDVDRAMGEIIAAAPEDAYIVIFSVHGMGNNGNDMYSMTFLPELLYRFNFAGKCALAPSDSAKSPEPMITKVRRRTWAGEVWQRKTESNPIKRLLRPWLPGKFLRSSKEPLDLISPYELHEQKAPLNWMPAMWYSKLWSQMKAFALPAFADGQIRINLQGREPQGIVPHSEYDALCDEITQMLHSLKDARTGAPIVKTIVRTRQFPTDDGPQYPDGDLVIVWREDPTDVVDSCFGRIGPIPYYRTGGHRPNGFVMVKGPGIAPGSDLPVGKAVDVGPTILELMGAPIPQHMDGKPLVKVATAAVSV